MRVELGVLAAVNAVGFLLLLAAYLSVRGRRNAREHLQHDEGFGWGVAERSFIIVGLILLVAPWTGFGIALLLGE